VARVGHGLAKLSVLLIGLSMWTVMDARYYGQPTLIVVGLVAASWWFCSRNRPVAGGAALALATALKPQVVILVPIALLVSGRYRPFAAWRPHRWLACVRSPPAPARLRQPCPGGLASAQDSVAHLASGPARGGHRHQGS
jgi:glycosyl transferase family 87